MNIRYYYNFVAIVEEGSLTAASRKLHIAQPALSNQIKALEDVYGARLFYRGARRLELTDAGTILYNKAKKLCEIEVAAQNEIRSGFRGGKGTLKVGVAASGSNNLFYETLKRFASENPQVGVRIIENTPDELLKLLQNGELEAVIARFFEDIPENFDVLFTENDETAVAYSPSMKLFEGIEGDVIPISALANVPLSVVERTQESIESAFAEVNVPMKVKCISTRLHLALMWAEKGIAAAMVPLRSLSDLGYDELEYKIVEHNDKLLPTRCVVVQKNHYRTQTVNRFVKTLAEVYSFDIDPRSLRGDDEYFGDDSSWRNNTL